MIRIGETICAPATSGGGAIALMRISGEQSITICEKLFWPSDKTIRLTDLPGYSIVYGDIRSDDEIIDEVLVTLFRAPHSYTGENSVEISCHASPYIQRRILELLIFHGAVSAFPGEFTQRAFRSFSGRSSCRCYSFIDPKFTQYRTSPDERRLFCRNKQT